MKAYWLEGRRSACVPKTFGLTTFCAVATAFAIAVFSHDASSADGPAPGSWSLSGRDLQPWQAVLSLRRRDDRLYDGCLFWLADQRIVGMERVGGVYIAERMALRLESLDLKRTDDSLGFGATYEATVSDDGKRLFHGYWFGDTVEAGIWQAQFLTDTIHHHCLPTGKR